MPEMTIGAPPSAAAKSRRRSQGPRTRATALVGRVGLWVWIAASAVPIVFMVATSLKPQALALKIPPVWRFVPTAGNYKQVLTGSGGAPNITPLLIHGVIITSVVTIITVILGVSAGYALTIRTFRRRRFLSSWILSTYMFPGIVVVVPVFFFENGNGLLNTYPGIILPSLAVNLPIVVWLVRRGVNEIPLEVEEAAMLDGLSRAGLLRRIVLPLASPAIGASIVVTGILGWNEDTFSLMLTNSSTQPAPPAVLEFTGLYGTQWGLLCAASVAIAAPAVLLALVSRRRLVTGLTFGAVN